MLLATDPHVLVYDVGGSHISAAICRAGDYQLGPVVVASHPENKTSESFVEVLAELGKKAIAAEHGTLGASLAIPGPFDYAAGVSRMKHKMPYLYGFDLRAALAARFGWQPGQVRFLNDAAAYLLGEVGAGAAHGATRAVGITLGTGIGSAFAVDGRVAVEGAGVPPGGEIWNLPFNGGIVEDLISTNAIRQGYEQRTGQQRDVASIAATAASDPAASEVFAEFGRHLGRVLKSLLFPFAPDVVVLGGGISRSAALFLPFAEKQLEDVKLTLRVSALGDRAPLVGAAVAWFAASPAADER